MAYNIYLLNGPADEPLTLSLRAPGGKIMTKTLSRRLKKQAPPALEYRPLPGNMGLLTIHHFSDNHFIEHFDSLYKKILLSEALVIDLRDNTGGKGSQGEYLLRHLAGTPFPDPQISSRQYNPLLKLWGQTTTALYTITSGTNQPFSDRQRYSKPVALLIGKQTVSAAEDFTMQFDAIHRGPLVGQPTAGSTGQPMLSALPGGGTFRVCVRKDTYPDGTVFVGKGIQPTVPVPENAAAFQQGRDPELEKAVRMLLQKE